MAGSSNDTSFINQPANSGFPAYLDFTTLRSNAINYLGPITGKYWTDYNVHDPGITTLEVLLYAIMDLGYRTNLPIGSLLASSGGGSDFFTPAQVFGCNPTAIIDYRKLVMDIEEVRNAWLEPDPTSYNGIYKIYIETGKDQTDFTAHGDWEKYKHGVRLKVKKTLAAFRNLCEDFGNIVFLKRTYIGVNAEIEIVPGTDTGVAYQQLVETLYDFFSPVPTFYTLAQLTAMNVSLNTVFEGRPLTGRASHGFLLDGEMPDRPEGEQTLYKSSLVQSMLGIAGIRTIRSLTLLDQNGNPLVVSGGKWEYPLPADALPAFFLPVSAFRWYQNGQLLSTQLGSYNAVLQMNALHSGKVIYPAGSPALDAAPPDAQPLEGLGDYYSIQNDYPLVYGIGTGGLPATASVQRQSQALQFKGYLLFFDQLLADYLAQLSNVGQLFSMNAAPDGNTFFGGNLQTVPGLDSLLRFPPTGAAGGATLVFPVAAKDWNAQSGGGADGATQTVSASKVDALAAYSFSSSVARDVALATVIVLFSSEELTVQTVLLDNGQWKYFLAGTDDEFVLVSRNSFGSQTAATGEATTVLYIGRFKDNYSLVSLGEIGSYTFNLVASGSAYYQYLQSILEKPAEFTERRTAFVEHLLARFAEAFTDYALLEAGFASPSMIADNQLVQMQRFLGEWPELSADRGKAFDYRLDGWNSPNTSGLERRFKAYCGIDDMRRHYLCHFEVQKMEERFHIALSMAEEELFTCPEPLLQKDAIPAVYALSAALTDRENYRVAHRRSEGYWVEVNFYGNLVARSVREWPDETGASAAIELFYRMWQTAPGKGDTPISEYQYRAQLQDHEGHAVRTAATGFIQDHAAYEFGVAHLEHINDAGIWTRDQAIRIGDLCPNRSPELSSNRWIDADGFKIYTRQNVLGKGKSERWSFEVLDDDHSFRFQSTLDFETHAEARDACCQLLHFLCEPQFYAVRMEHEDWYKIVIRVGDTVLAEGEPDWDSDAHAREWIPLIAGQARQRLYFLQTVSRPYRWKFLFYLGLPGHGSMVFESEGSFDTQPAAVVAARLFHEAGPHWKWHEDSDGISLEAESRDGDRLSCFAASKEGGLLRTLLDAKKTLYGLAAGDVGLAGKMVVPDETSKEGAYVYRLVDKDHPRAYNPVHHATLGEAEAHRDLLISRAAQPLLYLEVCLGGDNIQGGSGGSGLYYYQLKCRNNYFTRIGVPQTGGELVLFESVEGYPDADSAQAAFEQNYLGVLEMAGDADHYGPGKAIALSDGDVAAADVDHKPVVIVPAETLDIFVQAGLEPVTELVRAALSYPVMVSGSKTPHYRFVLRNADFTDWVGAVEYATVSDAHAAFEFFLLLLNFPGNFFIEFDWKECRYRIGIREVLAESVRRYPSEREAWGPRGVEKFICVAQHDGGWHLHRREDCSYSWFIACPNRKAVHPCTYENAVQRDNAMHRLIREAGHFLADGWMDQPDVHHFRLLNGRGHPIAIVPLASPDSPEARLNRLLDIADALWAGRQPERYGSGIQLVVGDGVAAFAITPAENWTEKEWMQRLSVLTVYFPIIRETTITGGVSVNTYRLEMKLPGFDDPLVPVSDCGCPPAARGEQPFCYLAWKDERVFANATGAWDAWLVLLPVIAEKTNYRAVFGEGIGCYGIELLDRRSILARNPQFYTYAAMAVESTERARARIDSEGLDIVEHLLLRPEISAVEVPVCVSEGACASVLPFQPGGDPYSFIVSVALPAWPARFRKNENRALLETILQREMPAHILARILWLTPHDMCRFEHEYAGWIDALSREAQERPGCAEFRAEKFIEFLFGVAQDCLPVCNVCGDEEEAVSDADALVVQQGEWLDQINRLYCWKDRLCAEKWVEEAVRPVEEPAAVEESDMKVALKMRDEVVEMADKLRVVETPDEIVVEEVEVIEVEREAPRGETSHEVEAPREEVEAPQEREVIKEAVAPDARTIRRLQAARRARYEQRIAAWRQASGDEKLAEKTGAFLLDPDPSPKRLEGLFKEIMKGGKKQAAARDPHRRAAAGIVLSIYLDRISMETGNDEKWEHLRSTLEKFDVRLENAGSFYEEWQPGEMRQLSPHVPADRIEALIREREKGKE